MQIILGTRQGRWRRAALAAVGAMLLSVMALAAPAWAGAVSSNPAAIAIPTTEGAGAPYPSTINVTGLPARGITDLNVTLNSLSHTWPDDLDILLVGPGGQKVMLMSDAGGGGSLNNVNLTFDDDPAVPPDNGQITCCKLSPSNYNGANDNFPAPAPGGPYGTSFSVFDGADPNGEYKLFVYDSADGDGGQTAGGWSLDITAPMPNDDFANAQATNSDTATINGDNIASSSEAGEPKITNGDGVWYRWTAPNTGQATLDMCASSSPMVASPYTGNAVNALTAVSGTSLTPCAPSYRRTFNATAGQAYPIQVLGIGDAQGNFTLNLSGPANTPPEVAPLAPTPGSKTRDRTPNISATVGDTAGLAAGDIKLLVDNRTKPFSYTSSTLSASPKLSLGKHTVKIEAKDLHGGVTTKTWSFTIR